MTDVRAGRFLTSLFAGAVLLLGPAVPAQAATTWYVANNGLDTFSPSCGTKTLPCRSVSKAVSLAVAGDTIIVGPGSYGDLNGSGTFGDFPGEEAAEIGSGCNCMIKIDKQLTILSRDGALVTVIDAAGLTQSVVHILGPQANGTVLGKVNKGFTVRNGANAGVLTDATSQKATVRGNIASGNGTGFDITGDGGTGTGNAMITRDNIAVENTNGFSLDGQFNVMLGNRAVTNTGAGFVIGGSGHKVTQNVAVQNDNGFEPVLSSMFPPFWSNPPGGFRLDSAIANKTAGVRIEATFQSGVWMHDSNLYGNGDAANNCGAAVDTSASTVVASFYNDYWGTLTTGPNPADIEGPACASGPDAASVVWSGGGAPLPITPKPKEFTIAESPLK